MKKILYYAIHRVGDTFYFCMSEDKDAVSRGDQSVVKTQANLSPQNEFFRWEDDWTTQVSKAKEDNEVVDLTDWG